MVSKLGHVHIAISFWKGVEKFNYELMESKNIIHFFIIIKLKLKNYFIIKRTENLKKLLTKKLKILNKFFATTSVFLWLPRAKLAPPPICCFCFDTWNQLKWNDSINRYFHTSNHPSQSIVFTKLSKQCCKKWISFWLLLIWLLTRQLIFIETVSSDCFSLAN